jgi:two-component system OmpR family sensor kinase
MGRLFWKFFFFFWLAQLATGAGVALTMWLRSPAALHSAADPDASPPALDSVAAAAALLRHAGVDALREYLDATRRAGPWHEVLVVDSAGRELFGRATPPAALARARDLSAGAPNASVAIVARPGGDYLLFVPPHEHRPVPPPGLEPTGPRPAPDASGPPGNAGHAGPPPPILPLLAAALVSLVFAALLAAYVSRPIRSLRQAFEAVAEGHLERRLTPAMGRRRDELADLGRDFDRMAGRLQTLVDGQRRLLHDVSHELRSPLARLHAAIGLARQRPERSADSFDRVEREAVRMDRLVGELLTLSRLEAAVTIERDDAVALAELLADVVDDARIEAEPRAITVDLGVSPADAVVRGDGELLRRAIENVVRNAVLYSPAAGHVAVELVVDGARGGGAYRVDVCDQGPGVAASELDAIFTPFYRGQPGRPASAADGHGLGLAIARRIVVAHGGQIGAANRAEGGLCVSLTLPVPDSPPASATATDSTAERRSR